VFTGALAVCLAAPVWAQGSVAKTPSAGPPPSSSGIFPLAQVKRGMMATAWTVFEGTKPESMQVEILGVLKGARGPKHDMILARLRGEKPEYTGVVAGMSGSPVYIDGKLLGALSYRIGQFSKEPIAGITPIAQMLEVRDAGDKDLADGKIEQASLIAPKVWAAGGVSGAEAPENFTAIETPLTMSGFGPEAIRLWKERMAGTGLDAVAAGGQGGSSDADFGPVEPGSAVSLQLMRGDMEMAATCTVTYLDAKHLLACGHPVMQNGAISLPMTATEVVATLASPLNAFKIVNTGREIGAFTEDRDAAIGGVLGLKARMIPVSVETTGAGMTAETDHVEVLDHPALTGSAVLVSVYQILMQSNRGGAETSYHVTGEIALKGMEPVPVNAWGVPSEQMASPLMAALMVGDAFNRLYANAARQTPIEGVRLKVEAVPADMRETLESVRLISSSIVHPGDRVEVEATVRPWQQPVRNVRLSFQVPVSTAPGTVRLLVSGASTVDRTLDAARLPGSGMDLAGAVARLRDQHAADQVYVSVLIPEAQASIDGRTLAGLPLSVANTMEQERGGVDAALHGESLVVAAQASAGGVLTGQQLLSVRVEAGGGLE
jgi:hypothetical protein